MNETLKNSAFYWLSFPAMVLLVLGGTSWWTDSYPLAIIAACVSAALALITTVKAYGCGNKLMPFASEQEKNIYSDYRFNYIMLMIGLFIMSTTLNHGLITENLTFNPAILTDTPFGWAFKIISFSALLLCLISAWSIIDVFKDNTKVQEERSLEDWVKDL